MEEPLVRFERAVVRRQVQDVLGPLPWEADHGPKELWTEAWAWRQQLPLGGLCFS